MTLDSSDEEAESTGSSGDVHQWCISAAHIGSLTKLDVTILEVRVRTGARARSSEIVSILNIFSM